AVHEVGRVPGLCAGKADKASRDTAGARGERGIHGHATDTGRVHDRKGRARIKAVPAKPQDQTTDDGDREIMRQHRATTVALECATQAGTKADCACQGDPATDRVNDRRASEVVEVHAQAGEEVTFGAHGVEETVWTPDPVPEDRIDEAGDANRVDHVADEPG